MAMAACFRRSVRLSLIRHRCPRFNLGLSAGTWTNTAVKDGGFRRAGVGGGENTFRVAVRFGEHGMDKD